MEAEADELETSIFMSIGGVGGQANPKMKKKSEIGSMFKLLKLLLHECDLFQCSVANR